MNGATGAVTRHLRTGQGSRNPVRAHDPGATQRTRHGPVWERARQVEGRYQGLLRDGLAAAATAGIIGTADPGILA